MTRRQVISKFGLWTALAIYGDFLVLKPNPAFRVMIFNTLVSETDQEFNDPNDFWRRDGDPYSHKLNDEFIQAGKLLKVKSVLSPDRRAVVLIKYYRSEADHHEYVRLLSEHHQKEMFTRKTASKEYRNPTGLA